MFVFTILACWYFLGIIGIVLLYHVDRDWKEVKRYHIFWCLVLWAWLGLFMWLLAGFLAILTAIDNFNKDYWGGVVYTRPKKKHYSDN